MKVKALVSFAGKITMAKNQEREITDEEILGDLISAGYVEEVKDNAEESPLSPSGKKEDSKSKRVKARENK